MKLSLKFQGHDDQHHHPTQLMTAKVPLSIFNHPFISAISASTTTTTTTNNNSTTNSGSEFSFSLSTNFPSGPSLKLSYSPTASTTTSTLPFSLSLKSGLGLLGSPRHSPLVFSANFTLSPSYTPLPAFSVHFKPQFGHFSLNKTVFSDPNTQPLSGSLTNGTKPYSVTASLRNNGEIEKGFVSDGCSSSWQELELEPCGGRDKGNTHAGDYRDVHSSSGTGFVAESSLVEKNGEKRGLSPGVAVMARTVMPVTKGLLLNLRWGVNLPGDSGVKMPYLTVNKIGLARVVEEAKQDNKKKHGNETSESDLELLKGMCFWMKRDLEVVEKENREMKRVLDEMRMGVSARNYGEGSNGGVGRKLSQSQHSGEGSSEFERWTSKKSVREENEKKEPKKQQSVASDVESELQKAIKAAASS